MLGRFGVDAGAATAVVSFIGHGAQSISP